MLKCSLDYSTKLNQECMKAFCESFDLKDSVLTYSSYNFKNSCILEARLSNFHKATVTMLKTTFERSKPRRYDFRKATVIMLKTKFKRSKPRTIHYRNYNTFSNDSFKEYLLPKLFLVLENFSTNYNGLKNL